MESRKSNDFSFNERAINCEWATQIQQNNNQRRGKYYKEIIKQKDLEIEKLKNELIQLQLYKLSNEN